MNMKKLLAGICTGALAISLAVPAFAAVNIQNPNSTTFAGTDPSSVSGTVSVKLLTGGTNLYINPYGVAYALDNGEVFTTSGATTFDKTKDFAIAEAETSAGFFTDTAAIQNNSSADLAVSVTMTTTEKTGSGVKVVAAAATNPNDNTMWGNFEITSATVETGSAKVTTTAGQDKTTETDVKIITPDWSVKKTVAIPAGSGTAGNAGMPSAVTDTQFVLPGATRTEGMGGAVTVTPGYGAYRLTGSVAVGSTNKVWPVADVADIAVAFTFAPAP